MKIRYGIKYMRVRCDGYVQIVIIGSLTRRSLFMTYVVNPTSPLGHPTPSIIQHAQVGGAEVYRSPCSLD